MSEPVVIIFAYHYPPENAIGGARPWRFAKYLRRLGYRCRVITAAPQEGRRDPDPDTEYVPDPFLSEDRSLRWQAERAMRRLLLPGVLGVGWAGGAAAAARRFLDQHRGCPSVVLSTCPPAGVHLAALLLTRTHPMPWIADFRDPLVARDQPRRMQLALAAFEASVIRSAQLVLANTDALAARWTAVHPGRADRIQILWNGFDPEQPLTAEAPFSPARRTLSHAGEIYAGRTIAPILDSIRRLISSGVLNPESILVRAVGPAKATGLPPSDRVDEAMRAGWLELRNESVSQAEARKLIQQSDGLLLIQPQSAVQVPGKLFEYLQIGRPVLAYIARNSPSERILQRSGVLFVCIYPDMTAAEIDDSIARFFSLDMTARPASDWFNETFSAPRQAGTLDTLIRRLI